MANVPTGDCEITEQALTAQPGWTWATPVYAPKTVEVKKNQTNEAKVTNAISRDTGTLKVTKVFEKPAGLSLPADFFKVDYKCQGGVEGTLSFDGAAAPGQSKTVANVPTGDCEITEQALTAQPGWTWATPVYAPKTVEVKKNQTNEAKVTNAISRDTGTLKVTKVFEKPAGLSLPADFFKVDYKCQGGVEGTLSFDGAAAPGPVQDRGQRAHR